MYELKSIIFLVFIVLLCSMKCDGEVIRCMEREREALLKFKKGLIDESGMLSSWGKGNECCIWEGIRCSNTTRHVIGIELVGGWSADDTRYYLGGEISSALLELHNLNVLNLGGNDFGGNKFPKFICFMTQLQHLNLYSSNFYGALPFEIGNLANLRKLDLSANLFFGIHPSSIGNLTNLRTLDLSNNLFSETLHAEIGNLTNIQELYLSFNEFSGIVPPQIWSLTNLKDLDLSCNDFTSSTTDTLINKSTNHVVSSLRTLNLQRNKLKRLPSSIWQFSMLEELRVSYNSLEDTITDADLAKLPNLKVLDLSFNSLTLVISPDWTPQFQLSLIGLSGCKVGPHFPSWLQTQSSFKSLDLSNNGISVEVPKWFWSLSHEVTYLNLSQNRLSGAISDFSSTKIECFDVSRNNFSGPIPLLSTSSKIFQISQNMFSGTLSFTCSVSYQHLYLLDLSNNQLAGKLPNCWGNMTELVVLNLANNNFSGEIPHALGYLSSLVSLHLNNNNISGELPLTLKNCFQLKLIDIGDNMLTGRIPKWIGDYRYTMVYLILRNNKFHGSIPPQICFISSIQLLDLSGNNLSGKIPPCFNNFNRFVNKISKGIIVRFFGCYFYDSDIMEYLTVFWKRTKSEYRSTLELLRLIDLSHNRLVGNIPSSLSSLKELHSLNLSRNRLTGIIDPAIGQMRSLESLDLSSNQLSGKIPVGIAKLNFLSVLDLSNNHLSGKIPIATQLQTFPASAYAGNIGLCGNPLQPCPGDTLNPSTSSEDRNVDEEDEGGIPCLSFMKEGGIYISITLGFIFGFWGVVGPLIVNGSWRRMFYNFFSACGDWLFVRAAIFWTKLRRSS